VTTKAAKPAPKADKPKATRLGITQLVVLSAFEKTFSTGSHGFFGQVQDPMTGKRYQVTAAVELKAR
jgi:hypothetical protein